MKVSLLLQRQKIKLESAHRQLILGCEGESSYMFL